MAVVIYTKGGDAYDCIKKKKDRILRKRFDDELIDLLLKFRWWDKDVDEIEALIPILTCGDLDKVKEEIKKLVG